MFCMVFTFLQLEAVILHVSLFEIRVGHKERDVCDAARRLLDRRTAQTTLLFSFTGASLGIYLLVV